MAIYSKPIINPKTATDTGVFFLQRGDLPARLSASGLAGSESVSVSLVDGGVGSQVTTVLYKDGAAVKLTATAPSLAIDAPGQYSVTKSATAGAAGVYLAQG